MTEDKDKPVEIVGSFPQNPDPTHPPKPHPQSFSTEPVQPKADKLPEVRMQAMR